MANTTYFTQATVNSTSFSGCAISWSFASSSIMLVNTGSVNILYSFDGVNTAGIINPSFMSGIVMDNLTQSNIWLALAGLGGSAVVYVTAWCGN